MIDNFKNKIFNESCLTILKQLPDNSIDSMVTDPPYGLKLLNNTWDYELPSIEIWKECFRVLKPGAHALVACGTKTQHRMAVRLEDAGFEIRDIIAWIYGNGFPKNLDISKAIDKKPNANKIKEWKRWLLEQINNSNKSKSQINKECGFTATSYTSINNKDYWSSSLPNKEKWAKMKEVIGITYNEFDWVSDNYCEERGYVTPTGGLHGGSGHSIGNFTGRQLSDDSISEAANEYHGYGTALKPAMELWTLIRKPIEEKTIIENILKYGTGAININDCRVCIPDYDMKNYEFNNNGLQRLNKTDGEKVGNLNGGWNVSKEHRKTPNGRWPANIIHDGSEEVIDKFPHTKSGEFLRSHNRNSHPNYNGILKNMPIGHNIFDYYGDEGSASRFFYCAKPTKSEKGEYNTHPTVKPLTLMSYLVKLITPKNGIVIDPFMGSGTTIIGAIKENKNYIGIELMEEYFNIVNQRINDYNIDNIQLDENKIDEFFEF